MDPRRYIYPVSIIIMFQKLGDTGRGLVVSCLACFRVLSLYCLANRMRPTTWTDPPPGDRGPGSAAGGMPFSREKNKKRKFFQIALDLNTN